MPPAVSAQLDLVGLTRALVDIDSTTGSEAPAGRWLADYLRAQSFTVIEQPVDDGRFNVLASVAPNPVVVFSTHFDCVPPFFPSRVEGGRIYGRGSCDAKGILAAQIAAADVLRRSGETRVGMLFVVGEERGSDGAKASAPLAAGCRYLVNGEPTDLRLGLATRGLYRVKLKASGRAAHSAFPELGESAIDKLLDALVMLRTIALPSDPVLGTTHYTVGLIAGGVAPNVVSPTAEAELLFRTVTEADAVQDALAPLAPLVGFEHVFDMPPVTMITVPDMNTAVFPYGTDIPFLGAWGSPLLYGPGSIHVAHTSDEYLDIDEQRAAVDGYVRIARDLLARG